MGENGLFFIKAGVNMKALSLLGIMVLTRFQAGKNLSAHPTHLRFGLFCKFFGDFWVYLGINSFSQRISERVLKFTEKGNSDDLMLL